MEVKDIMNSPMLWVMSSFMIINIFLMALMFFRLCLKNADKMGIPREECMTGFRIKLILLGEGYAVADDLVPNREAGINVFRRILYNLKAHLKNSLVAYDPICCAIRFPASYAFCRSCSQCCSRYSALPCEAAVIS